MMLFALRLVLAAGLLLSMTACVTTNATFLGSTSGQRAAVPADRVALYRVASQVPGQYEEIAMLNSAGSSSSTNEAQMYESMREKAGEVGANAVILDALSEPGSGAKVAAAIFGVSAERKGRAVAIWVFPSDYVAPVVMAHGAAPGHAPAEVQSAPPPPVLQPVGRTDAQRYEPDPAKRCDSCSRLRSP